MIKKTLLTLSLAGFCGITAMAQSANPCGTDDVYRRLSGLYPEIAERNEALSKEIAAKLSKSDLSVFAKTTEDDGTTVYHVPLVFHVLHDYGSENVTDLAIQNCVKRINELYNKRNADTADVIAPFKGFINNSGTRYIGNARIEWHLATIDPDGNPTNGITRRRTYLTTRGSDLAKYDQWPSSNYMNIWLIRSMSEKHLDAAAYAYKPATGDVIPYYDGIIGKAETINENDYTYSHELGHELNLDHVWGGTNNPKVACGDDDVDDTPPTKGHDPSGGCSDIAELYDTACLYTRFRSAAKLRLDSLKRADGTVIIFSSNSTTKGIVFKNRTTSVLDSVSFYPTAAIGSTYKIGLSRNNVLTDSFTIVSTVKDTVQRVRLSFKVPVADTNTNFKLYFVENPGALRDTVTPLLASFPRGVDGTIFIKESVSDNFYNFFYDWKITYGNFKMYGRDSLVDYPDTTNSQNVMDYTYCAKMFTAGQVERMRAALTATGIGSANRGNLITPENLAKTGALNPAPSLKPKADYSVEKGVTAGGINASEISYFLCADIGATESPYNFVFRNRTWRAAATSVNWDLSNNATIGASSTSTSTVTTKFTTPGWATVTLTSTNANGTDTFITMPGVYVADPVAINPIGYYQDFNNATDNEKWPIFNYFNNRYKWEITNNGGTYDATSIRYRSYDDRTSLKELINGDPAGDYDDFFTPAFDLSGLGSNGNLNFMYAGAYATNDFDLMKDVLEIAYSNTCGGNWKTIKTMQNSELQTVGSIPTTAREYTPAWNDWKSKSIDLKDGATNIRGSRVFFRFRYKPSARPAGQYAFASGNNFYMDRINISNNPLAVNEMILGEKKATVAPNPTNANAYVLFSKANANVSVQVLDITGKTVYATTTKVDQNNARIEIPASYISAKGFYMVHITGDDNLRQTEKLVVY